MPKQYQYDDSERRNLSINPLDSVSCEIKFPSVLKLMSSEISVNKIDKIQDVLNAHEGFEYTNQYSHQSNQIRLSNDQIDISRQEPEILHVFNNSKNGTTVIVSKSMASVTTRNYSDWPNFKAFIFRLFDEFINLHSPKFLSRIGLRYINAFIPSKLGFSDGSDWSQYIKREHLPRLISIDKVNEDDSYTKSSENKWEVYLNDHGSIGRTNIFFANATNPGRERCLVMDNDFYTENIVDSKDYKDVIQFLYSESSKCFRQLLSSDLNERLVNGIIKD